LDGHDIVAIGASSGGVEALRELVGGLPADLPAAVLVVLHFPEGAPSSLPRILSRSGPFEAAHPEDGGRIEKGRIYVAPPGLHMLVEDGVVRLARGPRENYHRPAADALFRSAAVARGPGVIGVVLTGARDDGTAGLLAIKRRGGVAVVQDPDDALFRWMPESAARYVDVDHRVPLGEMAPLLARLCRESAEERGEEPVPEDMEFEARISGLDPSAIDSGEHPGELSGFTCPDCAGPLYEIREGRLVRYRCRVGHAHTADGVLEGKDGTVEDALYMALNTLEESADMSERLASRSRRDDRRHAANRFDVRARDARKRAETIRRILMEQTNEG
jgi:two-component system, chemotaxis family, protein-glutamate methylesterase/glutaminase